ncbi:MAG: hypothetical protein DRN14_00015 [Thermoplasmata archaeon]|nr:MAG: hypothetical protein DRN14_00015 [Thermoplasmata archaeon]
MKCDDCGKEIKKGMAGRYVHVHSGSIYCYTDKVATPCKLPGSGEWCTGQQWVDAGGDWNEFVEAHKADPDAEYYSRIPSWKASWITQISKNKDYADDKECYRLRLDDKGELPKPEDNESCTALEAEVESWDETVTCANCKKAIPKAAIEETYYFCCDACAKEGAAKLLDTEYVKIREKRDVPLINPLRIPLGRWVAMEITDSGGREWQIHEKKPVMTMAENWCGGRYLVITQEIDWQGDWKDSLFSRKEILERWKQEYGDRWLEVAEKEGEE